MDDFSIYGKTFDGCLENLDRVLHDTLQKDPILTGQ